MGIRNMAAVPIQLTRWKLMLPGRVSALLAIALGLFVVAAIAMGLNLVRLRESFAGVEHTNEVLRNCRRRRTSSPRSRVGRARLPLDRRGQLSRQL